MVPLHVAIDRAGATVDGIQLVEPVPLEWFVERRSVVPRTELPEIAKGRARGSNRFHVLDELGVVLLEHHETRLIISLTIVFERTEAVVAPAQAFCGTLELFGVTIRGGEREAELRQHGLIPDEAFLSQWVFAAQRGTASLSFSARTRGRRLASVAVSLQPPTEPLLE